MRDRRRLDDHKGDIRRMPMHNDDKLTLYYALCRLHLLERHVDVLANTLKVRLPEEAEALDDLRASWLAQCEEMHEAFLARDWGFFQNYEGRVERRRRQ
jgi:hypothetical protein